MYIGFHKAISFIKSGSRILASILVFLLPGGFIILAVGYGIAEILGIIEELFEKN